MNLLTDPLLSLPDGSRATLPGLLAAMALGHVPGHPGLRPHQRSAWHMFLVQLAALALGRMPAAGLPRDARSWCVALRSLTPHWPGDEPWCLVARRDASPAFLQPPDPGGLKWKDVPTPDALDMLITARNHDLKSAVATQASAEDWVYALVSLQTCEGYGGLRNHGIGRMNGGASSRPLLGLAPARGGDHVVDAAAHWRRDVERLLERRAQGGDPGPGRRGGHGLLWLLPWPEGTSLQLAALDPWFIEVCRRVRLARDGGVIRARRAGSMHPRLDAKACKGQVGDPWTPVHRKEGKALTIGGGRFDYRLLCDLLFSGDWELPYLTQRGPGDPDELLLLAEALSRGNSKTEGLQSRVLPLPATAQAPFLASTVREVAELQRQEIAGFDRALANGFAVLAARGRREDLEESHYLQSRPPRRRFDRAVDGLFFPSLWQRAACAEDATKAAAAKRSFLGALKGVADAVWESSAPLIRCPTVRRPRATVRGHDAYYQTLRFDAACRDLFDDGHRDD